MFPKNMYIGTLDRDILKHKCNIEKRKKTYNLYLTSIKCVQSQYGIPTANNPILLQNFRDEKDGFIKHSQESYKV
jgi:hypothetical protein